MNDDCSDPAVTYRPLRDEPAGDQWVLIGRSEYGGIRLVYARWPAVLEDQAREALAAGRKQSPDRAWALEFRPARVAPLHSS